MKKLILIFGIFAIIMVTISYAAERKIEDNFKDNTSTNQSVTQNDVYTIKSENGRIVVYKGDTLYQKTSTATSTLPKSDQKELLYGISAQTKEQMQAILDDYCS